MRDHADAPYGLEQIIGDIARSVQLRNEQRLHDALICVNQVLERAPHFAPALLNRATILADLTRYEEGLADCQQYLAHAPAAPGITQFRDTMRDTALAYYDNKLRADPADEDSLFKRANIHLQTGDLAHAEQEYAALLAAYPAHQGALTNHGYVLTMLNRLDDALAAYDRLLAHHPDDAVNIYNRANVLKDLCRYGDARAAYQQAIALRPGFAEAHVELGLCHLAQGDFAAGWPLFEWRWHTAQMRHRYLKTAQPAWLGESELDGRTILLWAEQGLGDTMQFARLAPRIADLGAHVILRAPAVLVTLLQSMDDRIRVISDQDVLPSFDLHCPIMSLPLALRLDGVPALDQAHRMQPDHARMQHWDDWLGARTRPRIGLVWSGKQSGRVNATRDMPLTALLPLAGLDADFVCLHKDITATDVQTLAQLPAWRSAGALMGNFSDAAALVAQLDLVVSVDTAMAHLAGALGTPGYLLLRSSGEWRWQQQADITPWYPSLRILRQREPGVWHDVVEQLRTELA